MHDERSDTSPILDYTPAFAATAEVAKGLLVYVDKMPNDVSYGVDNNPDHLRWMIDEIVSNAQTQAHPVDKISRWLGYVQGTLRARGVLDTVAERDRTRPIFHRAYIEMGIKPPEKRDRLAPLDAVFERPDLEKLVYKWSKPFRQRSLAAFLRGLTLVGAKADKLKVDPVTYYEEQIFGPDRGYSRRALHVGKPEREFRFHFFQKFLTRIRENDVASRRQEGWCQFAGTAIAIIVAVFACIAISAKFKTGDIESILSIAVGFPVLYALTAVGQSMFRLSRHAWVEELPSFRKSLPWEEQDVSGHQYMDDIQQPGLADKRH